MNKEQAINIIKQLANNYRGTMDEHKTLQQAISVLEGEQNESEDTPF